MYGAYSQNASDPIALARPAVQKVIPPSPMEACFGKYVDMPVSQYTGTPQISIPLFNLNGGIIKLPVSVCYHASGLEVEEIAGWVGIGWDLQAGGSISR